jgi:membrane protein DedA with SNARE-associated domain
MFSYLEEMLMGLAHTLSFPAFAFLGSFLEEVIAPIPSPAVMLVLGALVEIGEGTVHDLIPLAFIGALGKTLGALVVYFIADKGEDIITRKFGGLWGVTHDDIEHFGKKLGNDVHAYVLLTVLRALPFLPSVLLSVGSGILKVPRSVFIVSTFFGTIIRDSLYLYVGFVGTEALRSFVDASANVESYVEIAVGLLVLGVLTYFFFRKKRTTR